MRNKPPYFLGIDIGTQGCRIVVVDTAGTQLAGAAAAFPMNAQSVQEQSPDEWWTICVQLIKKILSENIKELSPADIISIAVTSTSGTVIPLNESYQCLHPAIMYSDKRSVAEGVQCSRVAQQYLPGAYTGFNSSSGLSKMVWFINNFPEKIKMLRHWVHASDFISSKLSGHWNVTDYTNVLKSGFDLIKKEWPDYLFSELGLRKEWLPAVQASGDIINTLQPSVARELGLSSDVKIVTGMTDGCASQVAAGAAQPGDWNTTIGTTLVVKGIVTKEIVDKDGRIYNHLHPQGYWMPGGASNIGADWVTKNFGTALGSIEKQAAAIIPTGIFSYPLDGTGERFPFVSPQAKAFSRADISSVQQFASCMEGVAYIERYAFDVIKKLSGENINGVYVSGGATKNDTWLKIRSAVLNVPLFKMRNATGSFGAAILAASQTYFSSLGEATKSLSVLEKEIYPDKALQQSYEQLYHGFIELLQKKEYI